MLFLKSMKQQLQIRGSQCGFKVPQKSVKIPKNIYSQNKKLIVSHALGAG